MSGLPIAWIPREPPLAPSALFADGEVAVKVVRALLARDDEALASLRGARSGSAIVILGEREALPWADGVVYLGVDPAAPELLAPTNQITSAPMHLFAKALVSAANGTSPLAVVPSSSALIPLSSARPLHRPTLEAFLAER